jgi:hypothetical protein
MTQMGVEKEEKPSDINKNATNDGRKSGKIFDITKKTQMPLGKLEKPLIL